VSLTYDRVVQCIEEVFRSLNRAPPDIGPDTKLDASLGLESLDYAQLVVVLEDAFGFDPFAEGIPQGLETVNDLAALYEAPPEPSRVT